MQDDLAISAFLAKKSQLLLRILLTLKSNFSAPSIRSILIKVFPQKDKEGDVASPQPPIEQEESTLPSSPDTTRATEDA
ncbi:hypothetical protein H6768_00320 [Candidatus Peribacteria bacterium]|nr:hypothetical protein [Candidatus Peribacteria bacterium]